ncbi:ubiquitin-protein ligase Anaphase Promoting Complex [Orbilia oligospora]|uniref:Anaphase-promoting complex subunit 11 n=1 Tax=Orbilia oligospora TaxID=2813651 RepID=A0A7C8V3S3_ORBOL|nr:ubiquitin-protein ligase Anaphase Promoting Complex [Orbilia oligospora]
MKVKIKEWHAVATWRWDMPEDEVCGICRVDFDGCCPNCKYPGDDCPLIVGKCHHSFHLHCILSWINQESAKGLCPMCLVHMTRNAVLFWRPTPAAPDPTPEPEAQEEEGGVRLDQNEDEEGEEEGGIRLAEEGGQAADPRIVDREGDT